MDLRQATPDDLDSITNVMVSAFPMDPQWDYRFPYRKQFPEDHWKCTRGMMADFLQKDHFFINIVTGDEGSEPGSRKAVAVWELQYEKIREQDIRQQGVCDNRRDTNLEHMEAFSKATKAATEKYFNAVYGDRQMHLWILGTHPDYQRHGIGTRQCNWGIRYAEAHLIPVTVLSSPIGEKLYRSLGFRKITYINVQVEGEEEKLSIGVMVLDDQTKPEL